VATKYGEIDLGNQNDSVNTVVDSNLSISSTATLVSMEGINFGSKKYITVTGNGIVHLYVDGDITLGTQSGFVVNTNAKLYVYVTGTRSIVLSGKGSQNNVFLYAPDSSVKFQNAQPHMEFFGAIVGNTVSLQNQITIKHNPEMYNYIDLDKTNIGIEYTGYSWYE
jgi:hypothetical protein